MSSIYFPFSHLSIQRFSSIWHRPTMLQTSLATPILKRRYLDHNDFDNYRPVSNQCFMAKILEKRFLCQVSSYLSSHNLCNTCQSACRPGLSNIYVLALLDFHSAFDTIDHPIPVRRLHTYFGSTDVVLQWFSSYFADRTHYVSLSSHCSAFSRVHSDVHHGSVLGPMLFTMYIKSLSAIIDSHYHTPFICCHSCCHSLTCECLLPLIKYLSYFTPLSCMS